MRGTTPSPVRLGSAAVLGDGKKSLATDSVAKYGLADIETVNHQPPNMNVISYHTMPSHARAAEAETSTPCKCVRPSNRLSPLFRCALPKHLRRCSYVRRKNQWWWGKSPRPLFSDALATKFRRLWSVQVGENQTLCF